MKKLTLFFHDIWRTVLFFIIGYALVVATILLSLRTLIHQSNFLYAYVLGLTTLTVFLFLEYVRRHRFYIEVLHRLGHENSLSEAFTMPITGTRDQRLFVQLLHMYHQQYVRQLDNLSEKQRVYELFATRFAHQIKTPITVIQLLEDEMRTECISQPVMLGYVNSLAEERLRIETSIDIMLNTMRIGSFSVDTHMQDIHLQDLVREVVNEHKSQWIRRSIYPRVEAQSTPVIVKSDRKWLLFIVDQIVRNALQYGYRIGVDGESIQSSSSFLIQIIASESCAEITFSDEGIGIPARDLGHVFEPFYTGSNGRSHSRATGMGLYLVKEVAELLGHSIRIESVEGQGTTVTMTITSSDFLRPAQGVLG